jgi:hypothetical protein
MSSSSPSQPPAQTQDTAEAHAAFTASLRAVGSNLDADLRSRAANLHDNAAALDRQEADVKKQTQNLTKQNDQLKKLADQGREGLKAVGDLQNWAEMIERDLLIVEETLKLAEEEDKKTGRDQQAPESWLRRWF